MPPSARRMGASLRRCFARSAACGPCRLSVADVRLLAPRYRVWPRCPGRAIVLAERCEAAVENEKR